MNELQEIRRQFGWRMDHINEELRRAVADMADDAAHIKESLANDWNINGFEHTRGRQGAQIDALVAKRKLLAEFLHALDYSIGVKEAEDAAQ